VNGAVRKNHAGAQTGNLTNCRRPEGGEKIVSARSAATSTQSDSEKSAERAGAHELQVAKSKKTGLSLDHGEIADLFYGGFLGALHRRLERFRYAVLAEIAG